MSGMMSDVSGDDEASQRARQCREDRDTLPVKDAAEDDEDPQVASPRSVADEPVSFYVPRSTGNPADVQSCLPPA
jgi:hypothetical protein